MLRGVALFLVVLATVMLEGHAELECGMSSKERFECGMPGIHKDLCKAKGCCFDSSIPGVPHCFYSRGVCGVEPHKRKNCGWTGIDAKLCAEQNCCFDTRQTPGVFWCFHKGK